MTREPVSLFVTIATNNTNPNKMNPEDVAALSRQNARAANIWNTNFQKFPVLKLIMRLLSIVKEEEADKETRTGNEKDDGVVCDKSRMAASCAKDNNNNSNMNTATEERNQQLQSSSLLSNISETPWQPPLQQRVFKSDTLGFLQQQIAGTVQNLAELAPSVAALQQAGSFYLKARPPALAGETNKMVTVIAAIAKIHVAEVVSEALRVAQARIDGDAQPASGESASDSMANKESGCAPLQIEPRDVYEALRRRENNRKRREKIV